MKQKIRKVILGVYDLIISFNAIYIGVEMIRSNKGVFTEYPKEWLTKVPFESWVVPGIIGILVFGLGNLISAIFSFVKESSISWAASSIMGSIFFLSLVAQVIILGEWYMATSNFFIYSIIQLCLSGYVYLGFKKFSNERK